ncbi:ROK family protein [Micromonospora sp. NPDC051300]|uniref:ROK family transcriptional regulator n=1 Tax=Micromonospora sp. NPDC051300 TaxID=3364286 RepID=UPI0037965467
MSLSTSPRSARPGQESMFPASPAPGASQEEIRRQNLGAVLRHVHLHGPTSRAELTSRLGLNRSTIGALAAELTAADLVVEHAPTESRRAGRPSLVLSSHSDRIQALALSVETHRLRAARFGLGGRLLGLREVGRPAARPVSATITALADLVHDLEREDDADALLVGGAIAVDDSRPEEGRRPRAEDDVTAWRAALPAGLADPAVVVGDPAALGALAERVRGAATGLDDFIYLHGDAGVSAGLMIGGRLMTGHRGHSGKVGHMVVDPQGRPCRCGSRGCWETEIDDRALLRHAGRQTDCPQAATDVLRAAAAGEPAAAGAVERVADWLGFGVSNLVNVISPEAVVFGGSLRELYAVAQASVHRRLDVMVPPTLRRRTRLLPAALGRDAALIGTAELAFERLLADPLTVATQSRAHAPGRS